MDSALLTQWAKTIRDNAAQQAKGDASWAVAYVRACDRYLDHNDGEELCLLLQLKHYPVDIETFIFDPAYLGKSRAEIYPAVLDELKAINNPGDRRVLNPYTEAVFTGGIGSAKSTTALYTVAYQVYVLSCFRDPHRAFGLDRSTEILFIFQSLTGATARSLDYERFYEMVSVSPYFRVKFPFDPRLKSELRFPHRVIVRAIGADMGTIGQNVIGGLIDELNFMKIVEKSVRERDGGAYDQAEKVYNSISRRRKSRFVSQGKMPGILCLVSSKQYPGEFTDRKLAEAKDDPTIYVYDKRVWEVKPPGTFSGKTFRVYLGSLTKKAKVIAADEVWPDNDPLVMNVPVEYETEFRKDLVGAIRDIAGVSILARYPFFSYTEIVAETFGRSQSILNCEETDMETKPLRFYKARWKDSVDKRGRLKRRWAHVDLGLTSDGAGVACGYIDGFVATDEGIMMPKIVLDFVLRVKAPPNKEIQFASIRRLLKKLTEHGLPIKWVSYDTWQSNDSLQILRQAGFGTGVISTQKTPLPYTVTKTAIYQNRVDAPQHHTCLKEFLQLEMDAKTGKIDHPTVGSKDCSDAVAGVIWGLTTRRELWVEAGVAMQGFISQLKSTEITEAAPSAEAEIAPANESSEDAIRRVNRETKARAQQKAQPMPPAASRRDKYH